jgi:hypothetical protein
VVPDHGFGRALRLQPTGQLQVQIAAALFGHQPVGRLLQKRVRELVPAGGGRLDQFSLRQMCQLIADRPAHYRLNCSLWELAAGDGGHADHLAFVVWQRFQPRAQQHLDRAWQPCGGVLFAHQCRQVLCEQGVAFGGSDDALVLIVAETRAGADQQPARLLVAEPLERQ